ASRREAAERYGISPSVVVIWVQRFEGTGSVAAKPSGGSISPLEKHAEFLLGLIANQPDLTLNEIVAAMRKRRIAGSRSAVWRFFAPPHISCKKKTVFGRGETGGRRPRPPAGGRRTALAGGGCTSKACLTRRGWCSSTKPARTLRWCGYAAVLHVASGSSATRRMAIGKQSPLWEACGNAA